MSIDPLNVTRLRTLAESARSGARRSKDPEMKKQYDDIARHYDEMIEGMIAVAAKRVRTPT